MKRDKSVIVDILKRTRASAGGKLLFETREADHLFQDDPNDGFREFYCNLNAVENFHVDLMLADGLVKKHVIENAAHLDPGQVEVYLMLTSLGHDRLEDSNILRFFYKNVRSNLPTVITSVLSAVLLALLLPALGLSK